MAIRLVNLAAPLHDTGRAAEAEGPMRRAVVIYLMSERLHGHVHPDRDTAPGCYRRVLVPLGRDAAVILAAVEAIHKEAIPG